MTIAQIVLIFIVNTNTIKVESVHHDKPINYCVGYDVKKELWLSCMQMDGEMFDYRLTGKREI